MFRFLDWVDNQVRSRNDWQIPYCSSIGAALVLYFNVTRKVVGDDLCFDIYGMQLTTCICIFRHIIDQPYYRPKEQPKVYLSELKKLHLDVTTVSID